MLDAIENLLATDGVAVESTEIVAKALEEARSSPAGFADLLIAHVSFANGAEEVITFDAAFARRSKIRRLG